MERRAFVRGAATVSTAMALPRGLRAGLGQATRAGETDHPGAAAARRWRGFNLQWERRANDPVSKPAFAEEDFQNMGKWGFTFARLPISYWVWGSPKDWTEIRTEPVGQIDRAIELGKRNGVHINFCMYRIPGYSISQRELEPMDLFTGRRAERDKALEAAAYQWRYFARHFKGVANHDLSFDLFNEPPRMTSYEGGIAERYEEIVRALVLAIRSEDPERLIFVDGVDAANGPVPEVLDLHPVQATHCYQPLMVTHYGASWVRRDHYESSRVPTWPMTDDKGVLWDRAKLKEQYVARYKPLTDRGAVVHVSEFGCYNKPSHEVALAWIGDCLGMCKEAGWGWALWNFRGDFGVMDSKRADVAYEEYGGHKLDRKMLELLQGDAG